MGMGGGVGGGMEVGEEGNYIPIVWSLGLTVCSCTLGNCSGRAYYYSLTCIVIKLVCRSALEKSRSLLHIPVLATVCSKEWEMVTKWLLSFTWCFATAVDMFVHTLQSL